MQLRTSRTDEHAQIRVLLAACDLPVQDLGTATIDFIVAVEGDALVGVVGLERFGDAGLLRSLAVHPAQRGSGLGALLVAAMETHARTLELTQLVLLTQTAEAFFAHRGYGVIARGTAPASVRDSGEFRSLCPASATCMSKSLERRDSPMKRILFVCVENANRSQMAEAFARIHGAGIVEASSAGSAPSGRINPRAVRFMAELGYDLGTHASKSLDDIEGEFDAVITMGCGDSCPWVPAKRREEWALPDPKDMDDDGYRAVRDDISSRVRQLLAAL